MFGKRIICRLRGHDMLRVIESADFSYSFMDTNVFDITASRLECKRCGKKIVDII